MEKKWSPFQWTCKLTFRVYLKSTRVISGKFHKMSQSSSFSGRLGVTTLACFTHKNHVYLNFSKKQVCFALVFSCKIFILSRNILFCFSVRYKPVTWPGWWCLLLSFLVKRFNQCKIKFYTIIKTWDTRGCTDSTDKLSVWRVKVIQACLLWS